jgi:hypothetical protein
MRGPGHLAFLVVVSGCAHQFELPMTAAQFATYNSGPALVAYLAQPDASPVVCDQHARGPHLGTLDPEMRDSLLDALSDGRIEPSLWRRCANELLRSAPQTDRAAFIDAVGRFYRKILKSRSFETSPERQALLGMLQQDAWPRARDALGNLQADPSSKSG